MYLISHIIPKYCWHSSKEEPIKSSKNTRFIRIDTYEKTYTVSDKEIDDEKEKYGLHKDLL